MRVFAAIAFGSRSAASDLFEQCLPLKIGELDKIAIDDPQMPDAGTREHLGMRRPERAAADEQHTRIQQLFLPGLADLAK